MIEPHPMRCETCSHYHTSEKGVSGDCMKLSHWLLSSEYNFTSELGCASHSGAAKESSVKVLDWLQDKLDALRIGNFNGVTTELLEEWIAELRTKER